MSHRTHWLAACKALASIVVPFLLSPGAAKSNHYPELTLSEKVQASDIVVIARVVTVNAGGCPDMYRCARLTISTTLKGSPPATTDVLFDGPLAEADPRCCEVGQSYLFFLKNVKGPYFQSSNGPFGIYPIR